MSETKAPREISVIQSEYQQLCTRLGHVTYQVHGLQKDADLIKQSLLDLNLEAVAAQQAGEKAKAEAEKSEQGESK